MKLLAIPDPHAHPDYDNHRFSALGKFILAERPDIVLCIGDFGDIPSLSLYDKGTKGFEGRRYWKDVAAVIDAQEMLFKAINDYNNQRKKSKEKQYKPRFVMCLGNHENRINRAANSSPELDGTISVSDLKYEEFGWEVIPFEECVEIEGISFSHYFSSGLMGRPISGEHIGASMCNKLHSSAIQGHSHVFNHAERTKPNGEKIFGMSIGCYAHPELEEGWCKSSKHLWWHGVVILDGLGIYPGYYEEFRPIIQSKIMRDFG